jgi:hypothetical protein
MKWLALVMMLIFSMGLGHGYPIGSGNGVVNCTIFGEFKDPYVIVETNIDKYIVLNVDVSLTKENSTGSYPVIASYSLVDGNDRFYQTRDEFTRSLSPGRQLLGFVVPPETIPKALIINPTIDPNNGNQFSINFGELTNATNGKVTMLYYGIINSKIKSNLKSIDFDVGITNNGTSTLPLSTKNFSLIDQWGWGYTSLPHSSYTNAGFEDRKLIPNETARLKVSFGSLSPLSRPSKLIYNYSKTDLVIVDIDPEAGLLNNCNVSKSNDCQSCSGNTPEPSPSSLAGSIKATKARLQKIRENLPGSGE